MKKSQILILSLVLILSACSTQVQDSKDYSEYNGFEFKEDENGFWLVNLNTVFGEEEVPFYHHPLELENITYNDSLNGYLDFIQRNDGVVSLALDPQFTERHDAVAAVEIGKITSKVLGIQTSSSFTEPVDNLPVNNCDTANSSNFVVEFRLSNYTGVEAKEFCAILYAKTPRDILKSANLFNYKILGIMS